MTEARAGFPVERAALGSCERVATWEGAKGRALA